MLEYGFAVHVSGLDLNDDGQFERLENDQISLTPSISDDIQMLDVFVAAISPKAAWNDFVSFLRSSAPEIAIQRLDLNLVTITEIADRLEVSRETVRLWSKGSRRKGFPKPFAVAGQSLLWTWAEVFTWAEVKDDVLPFPTTFCERVNGTLARERWMRSNGWSTAAVVVGVPATVAPTRSSGSGSSAMHVSYGREVFRPQYAVMASR